MHAELVRVVAEDVPAPSSPAKASSPGEDRARLAVKLRAFDKRIGKYVESAARGALTKDKMRKLGVKAAADRLALEDALESSERRQDAASADGSPRAAARALADGWGALSFGERQASLREAVVRITVNDNAVALELR